MRVPDLSSSKNADGAPDEGSKETEVPVTTDSSDSIGIQKRQRRCKERCRKTFRGPFEVVSSPVRPSRSPRAKAQALGERQKSCPQGKAFYKCANGFIGCCSVDPCDPEGSCPDDQKTSAPTPTQTTFSNAPGPFPSASGNPKSGRSRGKSTSTAKSSPGMQTSSATGRTSPSRSESEPPVKSAPSCPGANTTIFHDASHIMYRIHCGIDNTYSTNKEVSVSSGGYSECFFSCSTSSTCAGFTFVGQGSGHCYLKSQMSVELLMNRDSSDYVSCSKIHPEVSVPEPSSSPAPSSSKKTSQGAIIGGALAGALLLILLIFVVAYLVKRHKRKTEQRRSTIITHISHGPIEPQPAEVGGHQRQVSTSHDVFQPYGGSVYDASGNDSNQTEQPSRSTPPGIRAEGGSWILPAGSFKRPYEEEIPMLYRASVDRSQSPGPRCFRFREHLSDLDDSTFPSPWSKRQFASSPVADSPTLGRRKDPPPPLSLVTHVKNGRRVFSRNPYEPYATAVRDQSTDEISPSSSPGFSDCKFDVPPLDINRGRWR